MRKSAKNPKTPPRPAADPRVVAIFRSTPEGFLGLIARRSTAGIEALDTRSFPAGDTSAARWAAEHLAARSVMLLSPGSVIMRAVQMPHAADDKLSSALDLNATTFVLGRTPAHRVATALLPGEHGPERLRTGLVAEWPEDHAPPALPGGTSELDGLMFAPEVAGLAALTAAADEPLVAIESEDGAVAVAAPTSKGVLVRVVRATVDEGVVDAGEIARAIGEACVHAGVPTAEINSIVERTRAAAGTAAAAGGFGCSATAITGLERVVRVADLGDPAEWWRVHGVLAGTALAALGPCTQLTRLASQDPGARPDRMAAVVNRLTEPRIRNALLAASVALIVLGPPLLQGGRLLLLRWKLPDVEAYEKAERTDEQKRAMYRILSRNAASMTKTLSDVAANTPQGVELDFVGIAPTARGQAITLRGRAAAVGQKSGTDALLQMEDLLRSSGMFEGITRSSEPPNAAGSQDFSIAAVAIRPTEIARYAPERDPAITSWRVVRYGPPPADTDWAAEGLPDPGTGAAPSGGAVAGGTATRTPVLASGAGAGGADSAAHTPDHPANGGTSASSGAGTAAVTAGAASAAAAGGRSSSRSGGATPSASAGAPGAGTPTSPGTPGAATPTGADGAVGAPTDGARASRPTPGTAGSGGLARRGTALGGSSNEPEPPPPPITEAEVNALTKAEAHERLTLVAKARNRADLDDEVKARLRKEFDLLLERCKRD